MTPATRHDRTRVVEVRRQAPRDQVRRVDIVAAADEAGAAFDGVAECGVDGESPAALQPGSLHAMHRPEECAVFGGSTVHFGVRSASKPTLEGSAPGSGDCPWSAATERGSRLLDGPWQSSAFRRAASGRYWFDAGVIWLYGLFGVSGSAAGVLRCAVRSRGHNSPSRLDLEVGDAGVLEGVPQLRTSCTSSRRP
jgi:hypothetical protein